MRIGLDIGATKTLGVVLGEDEKVLAEVREPTEPGPRGIMQTAGRVVDALRSATGARVGGPIGMGIPGLVDVERGAVKHAVNLGLDGGWVLLADLMAERLGSRPTLENDVNAASLGAAALSGQRDLIYLSIGTGLAAGLVLDGRLRRGAHGAAGEIGHIPVDPHGVLCECGQRGCLETVASGSALGSVWKSADLPSAQDLFAAALAGDPRAIAVRNDFTTGLAAAIRVLALTVDIESIVLGGGVAEVGKQLQSAVAQALRDQAATSPFLASLELADRVSVVPPNYPAATVGAALLGR